MALTSAAAKSKFTLNTPWIYSSKFDLTFILGPSFAITSLVLLFGKRLIELEEFPIWIWVVLVLAIDVSHVYSTLFRTYFDKQEFAQRRTIYIVTPLVCYGVGVALHAVNPFFFWEVLTYFAIYHFVRQQYGFMALYGRGEHAPVWSKNVDRWAIYLATIYPLVYWHTHPKSFQWFDSGKVLFIPYPWVETVCRAVYLGFLAAYVLKEVAAFLHTGALNLGKHLLLALTALSWYVGIVAFDGDLIFSLINIISHGVPYIALVWIYQRRKALRPEATAKPMDWVRKFFQPKLIPAYLLVLFSIAYFEEWIWDNLVWREHFQVFGSLLYKVLVSPVALTLLVPLLATAQATHYALDAVIWRVNKGKEVRQVLG